MVDNHHLAELTHRVTKNQPKIKIADFAVLRRGLISDDQIVLKRHGTKEHQLLHCSYLKFTLNLN